MRELIIITILSFAVASGVNAQSSSREKAQESLEKSGGFIEHLKTCLPFSYTYQSPLNQKLQHKDTIKGKEGGDCLVTYEATGWMRSDCRFNAAAIEILTKPIPTQVDGKISLSTNNPQSKIMKEQCQTVSLREPQKNH